MLFKLKSHDLIQVTRRLFQDLPKTLVASAPRVCKSPTKLWDFYAGLSSQQFGMTPIACRFPAHSDAPWPTIGAANKRRSGTLRFDFFHNQFSPSGRAWQVFVVDHRGYQGPL